MCEPVTIGMGIAAAVGAVTSAVQHVEQDRVARTQRRSAREQFRFTKKLAIDNLRDNQFALNRRSLERREIRGDEAQELTREALRSLGQAQVSGGVAGASVSDLIGDLAGQEAFALARSTRVGEFEALQLKDEQAALTRRFQGQLAGSIPGAVSNPSLLQTSLGIAGSAAAAFNAAPKAT